MSEEVQENRNGDLFEWVTIGQMGNKCFTGSFYCGRDDCVGQTFDFHPYHVQSTHTRVHCWEGDVL